MDNSWGVLGLDDRLQRAALRQGYTRPTLVQVKCCQVAISSGRDLMVRAKTGSGKTLAFLMPVLQKILMKKSQESSNKNAGDRSIRAIILGPTKELCNQINKVLQNLVYYCGDMINAALLSNCRGKNSREELARQEAAFRDRPDIIVATPTGLSVHIQNGSMANLKSTVETVVIDEADLVLTFGHEHALEVIFKALPKIYQGFLMSATLSPGIDAVKKVVLNSPVILKLEEEDDLNQRLKQFYLCLPRKDKGLVVYVFLKLGLLEGKGLFFVNTADAAYRLKLLLEQFHVRSSVLNEALPIHSRLNILEQFNVGSFDYLIATDESAANTCYRNDGVDGKDQCDDYKTSNNSRKTKKRKKSKTREAEYGVSRGLDFHNVSFVVNVDFPQTPKSYAHRIGRTARGGGTGVALSLVEMESKEQMDMLYQVQDYQPQIRLASSAIEGLQASLTCGSLVDSDTASVVSAGKLQPQPAPLDFDLHEIEGFRYRVEDVSRAVTSIAVKETRAAELKAEILNSERLQSHFEENPSDLQILRHDRVTTHISKVLDHLKHIPKYLLPRGMQVVKLSRKRKKNSRVHGRREDNDPLRSFCSTGDVELGFSGPSECELFDGDVDGKQDCSSPQKKTGCAEVENICLSVREAGKSTAGRNQWKERHKRGKFSNRKCR